jgi:hypothetical protein
MMNYPIDKYNNVDFKSFLDNIHIIGHFHFPLINDYLDEDIVSILDLKTGYYLDIGCWYKDAPDSYKCPYIQVALYARNFGWTPIKRKCFEVNEEDKIIDYLKYLFIFNRKHAYIVYLLNIRRLIKEKIIKVWWHFLHLFKKEIK